MRHRSQKILPDYLYSHYLILFLSIMISGCFHSKSTYNTRDQIQKNIERSYYPDGKLEYEAEFFNGKLDGTSRVWDENGFLRSISQYSNGKPHGSWQQFHINGKKSYTVEYDYGNKNEQYNNDYFTLGSSEGDIALNWFDEDETAIAGRNTKGGQQSIVHYHNHKHPDKEPDS